MRKLLAKTLLTLTILGTFSTLTFAGNLFGESFAPIENAETTFNTKYRVDAYQTRVHQYYLKAGKNVDVELFGDGYANLDLYVYDGYGNLIIKKESGSDVEIAKLIINRSEYFTVKVVNRGNTYNDYDLKVWEQ